MPNEGAGDGAKIPTVEAPSVEVRDDPEGPGGHDVFAVGPWFERASTMVFETDCAIGNEFPIDMNPIACDLHAVPRDSGNRLQQRQSSVRAGPAGPPIAPRKRDRRCLAFWAELDETCRVTFTDHIEAAGQRGCDIDANAEEVKRGVGQEKRRAKEKCGA